MSEQVLTITFTTPSSPSTTLPETANSIAFPVVVNVTFSTASSSSLRINGLARLSPVAPSFNRVPLATTTTDLMKLRKSPDCSIVTSYIAPFPPGSSSHNYSFSFSSVRQCVPPCPCLSSLFPSFPFSFSSLVFSPFPAVFPRFFAPFSPACGVM